MITVEVVSVGGAAPPRPMSAQIDQRGGTIGRSPDCTLVLVDEKRAVSRVHAEFSFRDGSYHVVDQGTNPLKVNGVPLGKGNVSAIRNGDRLNIGPYEVEIRDAAAAPRAARVAPTAPPPSASRPAMPAADDWGAPPSAGGSSGGNAFDDILGLGMGDGGSPDLSGGGEPKSADALFDELGLGLGSAPPSPPPPPAVHRAAQPPPPPTASSGNPFGPGGLPDDFDPMAPPPAPASSAPLGADFDDDAFSGLLGNSPKAPGEGSLDQMFGLASGSSPYNDPFGTGPLGKPAPSHTGGTDSGLTQWIGGMNKAAAAPVPDKVPELHSAYTPPKGITPTPLPDAEMLDLDAFGSPEPPPPTPRPVAAPTPPPPPMQAPSRPMPRPAAAPPPAAQVPPRPRPAAGPSAASSDLLQALLAGMNSPELQIDDLTPELMHKLGALMNEAVAGTIALLGARGSVKREMRADVTMIASGRNNPLKFSPDAGLALRYMFGAPMPGFMEADEAMRDAYSDLRAHEFGFMAGLRAALSSVLTRFEPGALEARLPEKGGLNALVPMNRKAKLWELFSELYRQIATEAEEDFHNLFGREFLRAYEEHIAALERGQKRRQ